MIRKIINFFRGVLVIDITGNALERFISQLVEEGIVLDSIKFIEPNHYRAQVKPSDFNRMRPLLRKRMCRVRIVNKTGFIFVLRQMGRNIYLLLGLLFFLLLLCFFSSLIWHINIEGLDRLEEERILELLNQQNIGIGSRKDRIDLREAERLIIISEPGISWINLKLEGSILRVEIIEKRQIPEDNYNYIVAEKDGIINEIIVLRGRAVISAGDTVNRGQKLIVAAGEKNEPVRGIVNSFVWYSATGEVSRSYHEPVPGNKKKLIPVIRLGNYWQRLLFRPSFPSQKTGVKQLFAIKWRNYSFPIEIIIEEHTEIEYLSYTRSREISLFLARRAAFDRILQELDSEAVIHNIRSEVITEDDNSVQVKVWIKTEEDIARHVTGNEEDMSE